MSGLLNLKNCQYPRPMCFNFCVILVNILHLKADLSFPPNIMMALLQIKVSWNSLNGLNSISLARHFLHLQVKGSLCLMKTN